MKTATGLFIMIVASIAFSQKTAASSVWASDRAHSRRYEAVLDTIPRTNSIVSMACCITAYFWFAYSVKESTKSHRLTCQLIFQYIYEPQALAD